MSANNTNKYFRILAISALTILGSSAALSAKITDFDQRINENIEKYTPVYGFGEGIVDSIDAEQAFADAEGKIDHKPAVHFTLKLEKPVLVKPEPWAIYGERFIGYTNELSRLQLHGRSLYPSKPSKGNESKQPIIDQPVGEPIPLVPGDYTRVYNDSDGNNYSITIKIEEHWLPIEIEDSGWITTDYIDARVFKANLDISPPSPSSNSLSKLAPLKFYESS